MDKDEPATFNINLLTGDITTVQSVTVTPMLSPVQTTSSMTDSPGHQMLPPDVPSSSGTFHGKIKPPRKSKEPMEKDSREYVNRRQRNNVAVRKSREKTRERSMYTLEKIEQLKGENEQLESKISILTKELSVLKDLFMDHARGFCANGGRSLLSLQQLENLLGCKVIKTDAGASTSSQITDQPTDLADRPGTSTDTMAPAMSIAPLFNVAELELKSLKETDQTENQATASSSVFSGSSSLVSKLEP